MQRGPLDGTPAARETPRALYRRTDTVVRTALGIQFGSEAQETVERFFRDCGLDDQDIENFQRHVKSSPRYRSAFICYARKDQEFVETLYARLKSAGVRCWID